MFLQTEPSHKPDHVLQSYSLPMLLATRPWPPRYERCLRFSMGVISLHRTPCKSKPLSIYIFSAHTATPHAKSVAASHLFLPNKKRCLEMLAVFSPCFVPSYIELLPVQDEPNDFDNPCGCLTCRSGVVLLSP